MNPEKLFSKLDLETLQQARCTYGAHKQIGVAAEECTELAKELIKAFRYDNFSDAVENTKEAVVDEVADVLIVLDHILHLYIISESDLQPHIQKKLTRLRFWLENSDSIEFTAQQRSVPAGYVGGTTVDVSMMQKIGKGIYQNEFLRLFDVNDREYAENNK